MRQQNVEIVFCICQQKHKLPLTKKARVSYQGSRVEAAISEANQLLDCLGHRRLERCVFRSIDGVTSEGMSS